MDTVRIVWGAGTGPTELAAYDAALADANVHEYNLVHVSSVIPADATVEVVGTAPDLGPAGNQLTVVEASSTAPGPDHIAAGLGWATGDDAGIIYEADGEDETAVRETLKTGLDAGCAIRDRHFTDQRFQTMTTTVEPGTFAAVAVLAAYGDSSPI